MAKIKAKEAAQVLGPDNRGSPQKQQESSWKRGVSPTAKESSIETMRCDSPKQCLDQLRRSK